MKLSQTVGRIAAILDVLDDEPMTVRQLAAEVGIPRSTAHDYLRALEANGRAERTPHGWAAPSVDSLFAPALEAVADLEHKDSRRCPGGPDAFVDRAGRLAA